MLHLPQSPNSSLKLPFLILSILVIVYSIYKASSPSRQSSITATSHYYQVPQYCGIYYIPHNTVVNVHDPTPSWLPQVSLSTSSKLYDTSSRTILTQTFVNPSKTVAIEQAKYSFPLYESCAVVSFRCFVGKRFIEGVVKGKDEAKRDYNKAVARGETAGLLEQFTPDVFRISLGNIPAGEIVKVEIEYIMELKHDAQVDGIRFTIPTSIAPRYGDAPSGLSVFSDGQPIPGAFENGMKISVQITMPSNVQSVQSPSHPISVHLGGHIENGSDDVFDPKQALATLGQSSTELGADFILFVKCADLSSPRALLETHPTLPNSKALMVTLVPKFALLPGPKPEIVFVVDRSGSMTERIEALKSSLTTFLKSLPVGVKFNICSFGSSHSFLWDKSMPYSADTLDQAQKYIQLMDADLGGTEILPPIKSTISRRYKDLPLEIMVLTDGEVWETAELFEYIEKETAAGDVRLFSLGIGWDVSHALVEGIARVGRGFAQIVSDEKESMDGKVVRMLRGGLSAHIKDYRLEWDGRPTEEQAQGPIEGKLKSSQHAAEAVKNKKKISLFNTQADTDAPISRGADRFAHLPELVVPNVLQTPYKLPPLFPFSRFTAYVIISGDVAPPSSVWLRGTTASGDELELEIPVQVVPDEGQTIHQLAARKLLQELEEGTGYLHSGKYGVDKEKNAGTIGDWVEREGVRVGVAYGLASKWTSFVAVQKEKRAKDDTNIVGTDEEWMEVGEEAGFFWATGTQQVRPRGYLKSFPSFNSPPRYYSPILASYMPSSGIQMDSLDGGVDTAKSIMIEAQPICGSTSPGGAASLTITHERAKALIALQAFEGSFPLTAALASVLGTSLAELEAKLLEIASVSGDSLPESKKRLWATVLAVSMFEGILTDQKETWELVVEKARGWIAGLALAGDIDLERLEVSARETLVGLKY